MECYKSNICFDDTCKVLRLFLLFLLCAGVYFSCMLLPSHHSPNGFFYSEKIGESLLIIVVCVLVNCSSRISLSTIKVKFYISDAIILIELLACFLNLLALIEYINGKGLFYNNYGIILHTLAALELVIIIAGSMCNGIITAIRGLLAGCRWRMSDGSWYLSIHRKIKR